MPFIHEGCGAAFGVGLFGHVIFDIATYALAVIAGVKIGCRRHKHAPESTDAICTVKH